MFYKKIDESCSLTAGMADRLGTVVPGTAAMATDADAAAYRSAVMRCAACKEHAACARLQAENPTLDAAPSYCRNW
jgi:hypothetical protein